MSKVTKDQEQEAKSKSIGHGGNWSSSTKTDPLLMLNSTAKVKYEDSVRTRTYVLYYLGLSNLSK